MPDLLVDPPLPRTATGEFFQTLRITRGEDELARARWHITGEGVVQLVELLVHPPHRRKGYAKQLLASVIQQATAHHVARRKRLRRIWVCVAQKTQVLARSFLAGQGFHHMATLSDVLKDEDALTYVRSFN